MTVKQRKQQLRGRAVVSILILIVIFACCYSENRKSQLEPVEETTTWAEEEPIIRWKEEDVEVTVEPLDIETVEQSFMESLGEFKLTAYCPCKECTGDGDGITSSGTVATQGRTVAVDPNVIPYGTVLVINGHEYIAEDCGGKWIQGKEIDIFFDSHEEAKEFGIQYAEIFIKENSTTADQS